MVRCSRNLGATRAGRFVCVFVVCVCARALISLSFYRKTHPFIVSPARDHTLEGIRFSSSSGHRESVPGVSDFAVVKRQQSRQQEQEVFAFSSNERATSSSNVDTRTFSGW